MNHLQFFLICLAGWVNRHQQSVIEYLQEEVRVLKEQLGKKPRFNDYQRRRLAAKARHLAAITDEVAEADATVWCLLRQR